jgi:chromosome partitioning protein
VKRVATYSLKGGVGKTTSAVNLAHAAARGGVRTLLWDLDPQAAATYLVRLKQDLRGGAKRLVGSRGAIEQHIHGTATTGLHVVPGDLSLRALDLHLHRRAKPTDRLAQLLDELGDTYDLCLIDCPAGLTPASDAVFAAADALLVPTIPTTLSVRSLGQVIDVVSELDDPPAILPFASMVDRRKRIHRDAVEALRADHPGLLPTQVPTSVVIERSALRRTPVAVDSPRSAAAEAYANLWSDVAARLWP